jgi:hypothetical protein
MLVDSSVFRAIFGVFMRRFDLHHLDTGENAEWSAIQSLMNKCEAGVEGRAAFEIWEADDGPLIVEVALAAMGDKSAWILKRSKKGSNYFLARGNGTVFYECIYWGCPEYIRDYCLLSRTDAELGIRTLIQRQKLSSGWQWIPQQQVFER